MMTTYLNAAFAILVAAPAHTQYTEPDMPNISRVCLWNADKDTWRALDLDRAQVWRLNQLRQQYPAVVDGQWVDCGDEVVTSHSPWRGGPAASTTDSRDLAAQPGNTAPGEHTKGRSFHDLQEELREVLSEQELRAWERMCAPQ